MNEQKTGKSTGKPTTIPDASLIYLCASTHRKDEYEVTNQVDGSIKRKSIRTRANIW